MKYKVLHSRIVIMLLSSLIFFSCGKSSTYGGSGATNPPPPAGNAVSIVNMAFSLSSLTVTAGSTVTWTNNDVMTHTVTSDSPGFDSGNLPTGSKFSQTFAKAGTFTYHCTIHPGMKGTIIVK